MAASLGATTYTSVTWTAGDVITEAKLDNMVANDQAYDSHAAQGVLLNNAKSFAAKSSGASNLNIARITATDILEIGDEGVEIQFPETVSFDEEIDNGNSGAADTIDWRDGNKQKSTVTDNVTYTFTAPAGPCNLILKLVNGGAYNPAWPATVKWPGGTEPSWTASGTDIIAFYFDGTNYYGQAGLNFS